MINVLVKCRQNDIKIDFKGHANYAKRGSDIICAGVSTLYCTMILALKNLGEDFVVGNKTVEINNASVKAREIIKTILVGLLGIQQAYPNYVDIAVDTREKTAQKNYSTQEGADLSENIVLLQMFSDEGASKAELTNQQKNQNNSRNTGKSEKGSEKLSKKEVFKLFKTKEEYQEHMDSVIGNRLKNNREQAGRLQKLEGVIKKLIEVFGAKDENELIEKLGPAIDDYSKSKAESDEYEKFVQAVEEEYLKLSEDKKQGYTFEELVKNEDFIVLLANGLTVEDSIDVLAKSDISDEEEISELKDEKKTISRPSENALSATGAARISKNVQHLTNEELADIVKRVSKGEKIKF